MENKEAPIKKQIIIITQASNNKCTINIHPSLLRLYSGATPLQRALQVQERGKSAFGGLHQTLTAYTSSWIRQLRFCHQALEESFV
nr:hypothetical protein [Tanacetum cinerariifolium]